LGEKTTKATGLAVGARIGFVDVNSASETTQEFGPLMMRGAQRDGKSHGIGNNLDLSALSAEDQELHTVCQTIGQKAAMKYRNVREALRYVDADHDGWITRSEVHYFFRAYDVCSETAANKLFDKLDKNHVGEIELKSFVEYLGPYIRGEPISPAILMDCPILEEDEEQQKAAEEWQPPTAAAKPGPKPSPQGVLAGAGSALAGMSPRMPQRGQVAQTDWTVTDWMQFLGRKSSERFTHVMDLIRRVDRDYDGSISRDEMRHFFSCFGLDPKVADMCWLGFRRPGHAEVDYMDFMRALAPYLDLPGVEAVLAQGGGCGGKRVAVKQRMGTQNPLDDRHWAGPTTKDQQEQAEQQSRRQGIRNLRSMMQDIGVKLQLKFRHSREAFRGLDLDKDGTISRSELRAFCRGFGYGPESADQLFATLDQEDSGEIDFSHFMSHFDSVLNRPFAPRGTALTALQDRHLSKEVAEIARIVGDNLATKHARPADAFRMLDINGDGGISRDEMRTFVRSINMPMEKADRLFQALDTELTGLVQYDAFTNLMGSMIDSGKCAMKSQKPAERPPMIRLM
jgi:Ca2+-binding EF-hand superfamily protein